MMINRPLPDHDRHNVAIHLHLIGVVIFLVSGLLLLVFDVAADGAMQSDSPTMTPLPVVSAGDCSEIPIEPELMIGELAVIDSPNGRLSLREEPNFTTPLLIRINNTEVVAIVDGPYCRGIYRWWAVQYGGVEGYMIESIQARRVMIPVLTDDVPVLEPGEYEETADGIVYDGVWEFIEGDGFSGGQFTVTDGEGAATFRFRGTHVTLVGSRNRNRDVLEVCLNANCQQYNVHNLQEFLVRQSITIPAPDEGIHTVVINKIASASVDLDQVIVHDAPLLTAGRYQQGQDGIVYGGRWIFIDQQPGTYSNGNVLRSADRNASASFRFEGTAFTLVTTQSAAHGDIEICVDGACMIHPLFSLEFNPQYPITIDGLAPGEHVVEIRNSGRELMDIDALFVE